MIRLISLFAAMSCLGHSAFADLPSESWKPTLAASFSEQAIEACLGSSRDPMSCVGVQAAECTSSADQVPQDYVVSLCTEIELDWWDARLNANYQKTIAQLEEFDQLYSYGNGDPDQTLVATYRAAQRTWIGFRDASCAHTKISTGAREGQAASELMMGCLLTMTAVRALEMEQTLSAN